MLVSIHQPEFLPWLPFFDKMDQADIFVILDNVQFSKNYFHNRCKIRNGSNGFTYFTLPVKSSPLHTLISEKKVDAGSRLIRKQLKQFAAMYEKTRYFDTLYPAVSELLQNNHHLGSINITLIKLMKEILGIDTEVVLASELKIKTGKGGTQLVGDLCHHLGATTYLSGQMGSEYLNESYLTDKGITVRHQSYNFASYPQQNESEFIPALSAADAIFNHDNAALVFLREGRA